LLAWAGWPTLIIVTLHQIGCNKQYEILQQQQQQQQQKSKKKNQPNYIVLF
jgi:hypothetical protein